MNRQTETARKPAARSGLPGAPAFVGAAAAAWGGRALNWAPRNNFFSANDVFGSIVGCADDFRPGQWLADANIWISNNCAGSPDTPPSYF